MTGFKVFYLLVELNLIRFLFIVNWQSKIHHGLIKFLMLTEMLLPFLNYSKRRLKIIFNHIIYYIGRSHLTLRLGNQSLNEVFVFCFWRHISFSLPLNLKDVLFWKRTYVIPIEVGNCAHPYSPTSIIDLLIDIRSFLLKKKEPTETWSINLYHQSHRMLI